MMDSLFAAIPWTSIWPFVVTCLVIELTPGPNMAYLAVLSLTMVAITTIVIAAANRLHARPQGRPT